MIELGDYLRERRMALYENDRAYSVSQVARRAGVTPSYLSQVERGLSQSPPSEETLVALADQLGLDRDVVLALAGKIARDLRDTIVRRPTLFAQLLRELRDAPDHAVLRLVREVRDGEW
jgi:HTH-type transcriptional regulator, competence development regulator